MTKDQVKARLRYALNTITLKCDERTFMEALLELAAGEGVGRNQSRGVFVVMADRAWSDAVADDSDPVFNAEGTA